MATVSSTGGLGMNVSDLVSQLVAAERAPADNRFSTLETKTNTEISAFGKIKAALSGVESALKKLDGEGGLSGRKTTVPDGAGFTASAGANAALGSYSITVDKLASAHKLQSAAVAAGTMLGSGTLTLKVGADASFDVTIEPGKGTLADIRDAINKQGAGKGVTATLVNGDAGQVLVLSSGKAGSAGALTVTSSGGGLTALQTSGGSMTVATPAQDAQISVDGISRTVSSNHVTDLIDGVTLDLTKAKPGEAFSLKVESDASTLKASLLGFVSAYNAALSTMRSQSAAGGQDAAAGPLSGDAAPRAIMQSLRSAVGNNYAELSALGLKTAVDGSLSLDGSKFDSAIASNPSAVKNLLGEDGEFGKTTRDTLHNLLGSTGMLADRSKSLNDRLKSLTEQRKNLDTRMERLQASYLKQFSALDAMVTKMQNTSSYLTQQLAQLGQ